MAAERLMIAFAGADVPEAMAKALASWPVAGATLFRYHNVESAGQVRALTAALQQAAAEESRPLLVATDQEGGQLIALGDETTPFAGAMALGAAGDEDLAERVAAATARELSALGVNVNYAPVCDLASNPANPALGIRCFGDDPRTVAGMVAATVRGLQSEGVAAALKHFPGLGEAAADTHHTLAVVTAGREQLEQRELVPFRAGIEAGARMVLAAHIALPGLDLEDTLPASLARPVMTDLLRRDLGFTGLAITDALDMKAIAQGPAQLVDAIAAVRAGQDLLLGTPEGDLVVRTAEVLIHAELRGLFDADEGRRTITRLAALRAWLAGFEQQPLEVVGCAAHHDLAAELAQRSVTLVRNDHGLLPLRLPAETRVLVVQSEHSDLTPADTSSNVRPTLAEAIRRRLPATEELILPAEPAPSDIAAARERATDYDLVVVGTIAAHLRSAQADLARAVVASGRPLVTIALRTPWDLETYPQAGTHLCTYGILEPSMEATAALLLGEHSATGRLPVDLGTLYSRGHGLSLENGA